MLSGGLEVWLFFASGEPWASAALAPPATLRRKCCPWNSELPRRSESFRIYRWSLTIPIFTIYFYKCTLCSLCSMLSILYFLYSLCFLYLCSWSIFISMHLSTILSLSVYLYLSLSIVICLCISIFTLLEDPIVFPELETVVDDDDDDHDDDDDDDDDDDNCGMVNLILFIYLSIHPSTYGIYSVLSIVIYLSLSTYLYILNAIYLIYLTYLIYLIYRFKKLSIYLSVYLSIYLSIYPSLSIFI